MAGPEGLMHTLRKSNVLPCLAANNRSYCWLGYPVFLCNLALWNSASCQVSDAENINSRELRVAVRFARESLDFVPSFAEHVSGVISSGSQEKMVRINAGRVVACVANIQPLADSSVREFIILSVGIFDPTAVTNYAVPIFGFCSLPNPAPSTRVEHAINWRLSGPVWSEKSLGLAFDPPTIRPVSVCYLCLASAPTLAKTCGDNWECNGRQRNAVHALIIRDVYPRYNAGAGRAYSYFE